MHRQARPDAGCASLALSPLPLIFSYNSEKSLCGTVVHLQRFEYNWEVGNRFKLNDRFEFPAEFDMQPYTAAGLRVLDGLSAEDAGLKPKEYYRYRLAGVLVHSGTADAGHYYTYVKRRHYDTREGGSTTVPMKGGFFSFDDTRVEEYSLSSNLENDCFGGTSSVHCIWNIYV